MKIRFLHLTLLLSLFLGSVATFAQRKCATVEYMNQLEDVHTKEAFENWMEEKRAILPKSGLESLNNEEEETTIYQIPVVVHIIHNGEAIGVGTNISESQILSQIEVLNEDFKRLNADSVNIPEEFKSLYSNIGFEFVMAKRDPDNHATNGITRTQGSKTIWFQSTDDALLKSQSYWPSDEYLNIWVANLGGGFLGWAQYPESTLDGVLPPYDAETDGIVIAYDAFGSIEKDPTANLDNPFDLGRTATHEIGHFFGLRHIWGDGGCGVDDYVDDTPLAEDNYSGCPSLGGSTITCGTQDMFMNYMDYVDDDCMNLFTLGQKERMIIVIENSPRRLSLTTSPALIEPGCEDIALLSFTSPQNGICSSTVYPSIEVKNVGTCFVDSFKISLKVNDLEVATTLFDLELDLNETQEVQFNPIDLVEYGNTEFTAEVISVNETEDEHADNNTISIVSLYPEPVSELFEDFSSTNPLWSLRTDQQVSQYDTEQAVFYNIENIAGVFNYYKSSASNDAYVSPKLYVDGTDNTLLFDIAYGYRQGFDDSFAVLASTNCGTTFPDTLFFSQGHDLASAESSIEFYPSGAMDWMHYQVGLADYANQEIVLSFTGISSGGNRIYIDNIRVVNSTFSDVAIVGLSQPPMLCDSEALLTVENKGTEAVSELNLKILQGSTTTLVNYSQLSLATGEDTEIVLSITDLNSASEVTIALSDNDSNAENDTITQTVVTPIGQVEMPLRERFDNILSLPDGWYAIGHDTNANMGWKLNNNRLELMSSEGMPKGLKETIVLPPLNMENLLSASLHFDLAYAYDGVHEELLRVKASTDCGKTYEPLFENGGESLATSLSTSETWEPSSEDDWNDTYVDLSSYAGHENVQIVVELTSAQGGNVFIDNIELYSSNVVDPLAIEENTLTVSPNPVTGNTIHFTVNLEEAEPAQLNIINSQGSTIASYDIPKTLNQTFDIPAHHLPNGMYFVKLVSDEQILAQRFIITR